MEPQATGIKQVKIGNDQSYEWGTIENKFGKIKKYAHVDYYWYGSVWKKIIESMKSANMRPAEISFYKGAQIDEVSKTVRMRGDFIREIVFDKHRAFWRAFFHCGEKEEPKFVTIGKIIKIPNIAGDNDSLNFYIEGQNINEILSESDEENVT